MRGERDAGPIVQTILEWRKTMDKHAGYQRCGDNSNLVVPDGIRAAQSWPLSQLQRITLSKKHC